MFTAKNVQLVATEHLRLLVKDFIVIQRPEDGITFKLELEPFWC